VEMLPTSRHLSDRETYGVSEGLSFQ